MSILNIYHRLAYKIVAYGTKKVSRHGVHWGVIFDIYIQWLIWILHRGAPPHTINATYYYNELNFRFHYFSISDQPEVIDRYDWSTNKIRYVQHVRRKKLQRPTAWYSTFLFEATMKNLTDPCVFYRYIIITIAVHIENVVSSRRDKVRHLPHVMFGPSGSFSVSCSSHIPEWLLGRRRERLRWRERDRKKGKWKRKKRVFWIRLLKKVIQFYMVWVQIHIQTLKCANMASCQGPSYRRRTREDGCGEGGKGGWRERWWCQYLILFNYYK